MLFCINISWSLYEQLLAAHEEKSSPLGVRLHAAPQRGGCQGPAGHHHGWGPGWALAMPGRGIGRKAGPQTVQEPREPAADGPAAPAERDALAPQLCAPRALLGRQALVPSMRATLATTRFTLMRLCTRAGRAMALVLVRAPCWTRVSDDQGCEGPP